MRSFASCRILLPPQLARARSRLLAYDSDSCRNARRNEAPFRIPFRRSFTSGREVLHIQRAIARGELGGGGTYGAKCQEWLCERYGSRRALLTTSCTAALEMAALLVGVEPGDEVIMPSYTFPSLANAFLLRGARPVFIDVCNESLCLDPRELEGALTEKTRAIALVHVGSACEIDEITSFAHAHDLCVIEDTALAFNTPLDDGRLAGTFGSLGALSFHATKDISAGEAGALLINDPALIERAEIVWEKGTNRRKFVRNEVSRYEWHDIGGSFAPSELVAAYLFAQLEAADHVRARRLEIAARYRRGLRPLISSGRIRIAGAADDAHMLCLVTARSEDRDDLRRDLASHGIEASRHYAPLHSTSFGRNNSRVASSMTVTKKLDSCLLRLPLYPSLTQDEVDSVVDAVLDSYRSR